MIAFLAAFIAFGVIGIATAAPASEKVAEKETAAPAPAVEKKAAAPAPAVEKKAAAPAPAVEKKTVAPVKKVENRYAPRPVVRRKTFYDTYIRNRLSAGVKFSQLSLENGDRPPDRAGGKTFVGNVNHLEEGDDPVTFSLEYQICDYLRLEFSQYEVSASTLNYNNDLGDGEVVMDGPYVGLKVQYPLFDGWVIPYVSGGVAFLSGDFEEYYWWHNGWSSRESWESRGSPRERRTPYYREIDVEDSTEFVYGFGVTFHIYDRLELEAFMNFSSPDPACKFGYRAGTNFDTHREGDFDLENSQIGLCARFVF